VESFRVDDAVLAGAPRLAVVHKFGTITANIDLAACAARGVAVATLRRMVNVAVAEQACALMLALAKRMSEFNGVVEEAALRDAGLRVRARQSRYIGYSNFAGITGLKTVLGATLGIVGFGEVGREVARRARAFEMEVVYFQRTPLAASIEQEFGARYLPLNDLMGQADYILVQLPSTDATRGLIGRDALAHLKPGAMLIDVARPELIDHDALVEALDAGRLGGLGLDVLYSEPADPAEPLLRYRDRNVILMPHTAIGARANALHDVETLCVNLWRGITGKRGA
jgi:lactate dehydrogenase-like 2-hydroxyacid dehydrogenase